MTKKRRSVLQGRLLNALSVRPAKSLAELAAATKSHRPSVSRSIKTLKDEGLVVDDGAVWKLTSQGESEAQMWNTNLIDTMERAQDVIRSLPGDALAEAARVMRSRELEPLLNPMKQLLSVSKMAGLDDPYIRTAIKQASALVSDPQFQANMNLARQAAASLATVTTPISTAIASPASITRTLLVDIWQSFQPFRQAHDLNQRMEATVAAFEAAGWPLAPSMSQDLIQSVVDAHANDEPETFSQTVDETIMAYYRRDDHRAFNEMVAGWHRHPLFIERMKILTDAATAHTQGTYTLSVPAAVAQIEGVLFQHACNQGISVRAGSPTQITEGVIKDPDNFPVSEWMYVAVLKSQLLNLVYPRNEFHDEIKLPASERAITRHTTLHGVATNYDQESYSLKAFLWLDAVAALTLSASTDSNSPPETARLFFKGGQLDGHYIDVRKSISAQEHNAIVAAGTGKPVMRDGAMETPLRLDLIHQKKMMTWIVGWSLTREINRVDANGNRISRRARFTKTALGNLKATVGAEIEARLDLYLSSRDSLTSDTGD